MRRAPSTWRRCHLPTQNECHKASQVTSMSTIQSAMRSINNSPYRRNIRNGSAYLLGFRAVAGCAILIVITGTGGAIRPDRSVQTNAAGMSEKHPCHIALLLVLSCDAYRSTTNPSMSTRVPVDALGFVPVTYTFSVCVPAADHTLHGRSGIERIYGLHPYRS